jgi:hypothetical protein
MHKDRTAPIQGNLSDFPSDRLPWAALLVLTMAGFICILAETLPVGLLPHINEGLGISEALFSRDAWGRLFSMGSVRIGDFGALCQLAREGTWISRQRAPGSRQRRASVNANSPVF